MWGWESCWEGVGGRVCVFVCDLWHVRGSLECFMCVKYAQLLYMM